MWTNCPYLVKPLCHLACNNSGRFKNESSSSSPKKLFVIAFQRGKNLETVTEGKRKRAKNLEDDVLYVTSRDRYRVGGRFFFLSGYNVQEAHDRKSPTREKSLLQQGEEIKETEKKGFSRNLDGN